MAQDDRFGRQPPGSFDGVEFPVISVSLTHGSAAAFHRYPHRPGQRVEHTGRDPVAGTARIALFRDMLDNAGNLRQYWPEAAELLREKCQLQRPSKLFLPTYGTIASATCTLAEEFSSTLRDGCYATLSFQEVDNDQLVARGAVSAKGKLEAQSVAAKSAVSQITAPTVDDADGGRIDLSSAIDIMVQTIQGYDEQLATRIERAGSVVASIDRALGVAGDLSNPDNWESRQALLGLKDSSLRAIEEVLSIGRRVKAYVPATDMTVMDVSLATGNSFEELQGLNVIADPFRLIRGEPLLVYEKSDIGVNAR